MRSFCCVGAGGEWEGIEAAGFVVARIVADAKRAARCKSVGDVNAAAQDAEIECVIEAITISLLSEQAVVARKWKMLCLEVSDGRDITAQWSRFIRGCSLRLAENPPVLRDACWFVSHLVPALHVQDVLVKRWKLASRPLTSVSPKKSITSDAPVARKVSAVAEWVE